jgi:hypothetical protein
MKRAGLRSKLAATYGSSTSTYRGVGTARSACCTASAFVSNRNLEEIVPRGLRILTYALPSHVFVARLAPQKFAPTWKQVADHYAGSEIKVGAVNCIDNKELCRTLSIGLFPALRALNVAVEAGGTQPGENGLLTIQDGAIKFQKILDWVKQRYPNAVTAGSNDAAVAAVAEEQVPAVVDAAKAQQPAAAAAAALGGDSDDKVSAAAAAAFVLATCEQRFVDAASSFSFALQNHVPSGKGAMQQSRTGEHCAAYAVLCAAHDHST